MVFVLINTGTIFFATVLSGKEKRFSSLKEEYHAKAWRGGKNKQVM
ncbi:MAG TPA: hypothetical protein VKA38_04915 [Draconibacterium sp.]|nr:hypothetical protein [Draconibacterium sp.]